MSVDRWPFQALAPEIANAYNPPPRHNDKSPAKRGFSLRVSDGTRTRDRLDHNQELYQLSYAHHGPNAV
jgi:hypothetical protein